MIHNYQTRNAGGSHLHIKKFNIVCKSYLMESPKLWLNLPVEIKNSNNIKLFTERLKKFLIFNDV